MVWHLRILKISVEPKILQKKCKNLMKLIQKLIFIKKSKKSKFWIKLLKKMVLKSSQKAKEREIMTISIEIQRLMKNLQK